MTETIEPVTGDAGTSPPSPAAPPTASGLAARPGWERHPADVARLFASLVLLAALLVLSGSTPSGMLDVSVDIIALFDNLPTALTSALVGLVQVVVVIAPVAAVAALVVRRRFDLLLLFTMSAALAAVAMVFGTRFVAETVPIDELGYERVESWFVGGTFPSATLLAALTAVLVTAAPWLRRAWRRAGWLLIAAVTVARILTATEVPLRVGVLIAVGIVAGSAALVVVGAPPRRVDPAIVTAALARAGLAADEVELVDRSGGVHLFRASAATGVTPGGSLDVRPGEHLFVRVTGRDDRDAAFLLSWWRRLRLKGLGDDAPTGRALRIAEHEALAAAVAAAAGCPVPRPAAVATTDDEVALVALLRRDGRPLHRLAPGEIDDELLDRVWRAVAVLQRRRIAHRALRAPNVIVHDDGEITLTDLRLTELAAADLVLGADVAELAASLAILVGVERSVAAAARSLRPDELERAVPLVQRAVLSGPTRALVKQQGAMLDDLRTALASAAGAADVAVAPVSRITIKGAVSLLGSVVLLAYVLSLVSNWDQIWSAFTSADLAYVIPILVMMVATYFTGAMSMLGASPIDLPFVTTTQVMFGQSFLNRFTPANAGGMAMRMRYLQLRGLDAPTAAASVGLTSAASGLAQGVMIVVFLVWGGASDRFSDFEMPDVGGIVIAVLAIGAVGGAIVLSGWGRRVVLPKVREAAGKVRRMVVELARDPGKMALLFGGAILGKLANIVAFWCSCQAFDVDISFPKAGALYMIANSVGSAVPTPGGVGGVDAALTAVLLSFGVDNATAAAVVLLFRTLTFWLPTVPGYGFMRYVQAKGIV